MSKKSRPFDRRRAKAKRLRTEAASARAQATRRDAAKLRGQDAVRYQAEQRAKRGAGGFGRSAHLPAAQLSIYGSRENMDAAYERGVVHLPYLGPADEATG